MTTDVTQYLPHRPPFLFLDHVETRPDGVIVGSRLFREDEFFFKGHFPSYPVVPGVILIESMAQCGGAALVQAGIVPYRKHFFLATVKEAKFRRQVRPGDEVRFEIHNLRTSAKMVRQRGACYVGDELAVEGEWLCVIAAS
ncbi:MAG: 3-hydroxyacyl-ACP dehydratase FabZ [Kiritimatiellae bacterium]|nr:3-hydroxyacyl-ACP dehydratase FabZ [Kiritimatiellia bacterium]